MSNARYLTFFLALFALMAFAANSILCRMALMQHAIGALEFTLIRLLAGIVALMPILLLYRGNELTTDSKARTRALAVTRPNFLPSLALLSYALFFSLAYVRINVATGSLILFPAVQITMVGGSIYQGNRLNRVEWLGFLLAFGGLVYLLLPGISAPPLAGSLLMLAAGSSWGIYSLLGKDETYPILSTARNFLFCIPGCLLLVLFISLRAGESTTVLTLKGILLAALSGGVASALGYVLWYVTLRRISMTIASIMQLAVPVIAGMGGVFFLSETLSFRLVSASLLIIGGIVVTILGRRPRPQIA